MYALTIDHITKSYGSVEALRGVSVDVAPGELFGVIGPDGAGKSTLFRILTTLLVADSGRATVMGHDVVEGMRYIRRAVGYMPGRFSLYQDLTVEENLQFYASVFQTTVEENYALVAPIYSQIEPFKNRRAGKLSGGMKQKLALSCALIHKPEVLFLDEPTTGVDPVSRKEFWDMLDALRRQGITIVVSTPYMDEAERCDRIALIQHGEFLTVNTPPQIVADYPDQLWAVSADDKYKLLLALREFPSVLRSYAFGATSHVAADRGGLDPDELCRYLQSKGLSQVEVKQIEPCIEDCFMQMAQ